MNENLSTKERLVSITIEEIDKKGGALHVGLRDIAHKAGCAAPNVYNYFKDFNELLNEAHLHIIADFNTNVTMRALREPSPLGMLMEAARAFIRYAIDHRGWFNCFHYEKHDFPTSRETDLAAEDAGNRLVEIVRLAGGSSLGVEHAQYVTRVLHGFLLGELSAIVTGKHRPPDLAEYSEKLAGSCLAIFKALVESPAPKITEVLI